MSEDLKTFVTEDWQMDALRVVLVNHHLRRVAMVRDTVGGSPMLAMEVYDPEAITREDEQEVGILLPLVVARAIYEALGRHFGDHQDPASRELVDALKVQAQQNGERLDGALGALIQIAVRPPVLVNGGEVRTMNAQ